MLSNLLSQLKQMNALDKFDEALAETPRVRADLGYPPLVTPTSQMVGVQAVRNVLDGERYKTVSKEITSPFDTSVPPEDTISKIASASPAVGAISTEPVMVWISASISLSAKNLRRISG